jgi:excisionase family DNA binding protein
MEKSTELTPRLAARKLGVSLYYIYQSLWAGKLPGRKIDKQWRIPAEAIEARLKRRGQ